MGTPSSEPEQPDNIKPRPDYPPKTPPPPKRPPSPPPPDPPRSEAELLLEGLPVPQRSATRAGLPVMRNRRGASWTLETGAWIPKKAAGHITGRLTDWGLTAPGALHDIVTLLVSTVIADGGRRVSVHLSEQDGRIVVLALSHQPPDGDLPGDMLATLRGLGASSCGTETTGEGRQVWALLDVLPIAA
ncbi:hypothetical protein ACFW9D_05910 [Streptomyces sp. NPDC059524]|uniref:hypothetical protein n=1 Tax=Streptomyces sp. NPDC059524 TaxID=3346856 RepID=UPI003698F754